MVETTWFLFANSSAISLTVLVLLGYALSPSPDFGGNRQVT
jgi:hypothetical protein